MSISDLPDELVELPEVPEELEELPEDQMKQDPFLGATIERTVDGTVFRAVIKQIQRGKNSGHLLYRIQYTDGDLQDVSERELLVDSKLIKVLGDPDVQPDGNLAADFRQLWMSGQLSDVSLQVHTEEIRAHRLILGARSPVFKQMFATSMAENATGIVHIEEMSYAAMHRLCEFIYTGTIEDKQLWRDSNAIYELLHAALKYEVVSVMCACVSKAEEQITVTNVVDWFIVASRIQAHAQKLKFFCIQFILQNMAEVQCTSGWSDLMQNKALLSEAAPILFRGLCPPAKRTLDQRS